MTISRGRLLEYLYQLAGSPVVKNLPEKSPYTDLTPGDARYKVAYLGDPCGFDHRLV